MEEDSLAGPSDMCKQPVLDGAVLSAVRWVVRNAVTTELARVAAGIEVHVPFVGRQVVESVRDQDARPSIFSCTLCAGQNHTF